MAMDPTLAKMLDLRFFHDNGFARRTCPTCEEPFWTQDPERTLCGDSTCEEYQFLGDPLTDTPMSLREMREAFLAYWEGAWDGLPGGKDLGDAPKDFPRHGRVPRNPVVARWRDDLYLNIASIANYQPHVTSGEVKPPANPLVVSQPCIRLNDLANIGRSGRHFACFEMMGHHAFNSKDWGEHYWTEECVSWGHRFLTDVLGLDGTRITYKESTWSGGGNAGPCVEVFAGGLEVATLVFMCLEECEEGDDGADYQIKGDWYRMMALKIIDTGWGLERLAWASTGTPTAYDTVFPETIKHIRSLATVPIAEDERAKQLVEMHARVQGVLNLDIGTKLDGLREEVVRRMAENGIETTAEELESVMDPIEAMYALSDHLRCLSFMVGDGIVPSNVKAGYLERLVFRRAFRFQQRLGIEAPLSELLAWNMKQMLSEFPEFEDAIDRAKQIAELEHERYQESRERGLRLVERTLKKKKELDVDDLVELYDTHGLGPNAVAEAAKKMGITVEVPDTFDAIIADRHSKEKKTKAKRIVPPDVPETRRIFYEEEGQDQQEFDAEVLEVFGPDTAEHRQLLDRAILIGDHAHGNPDQEVLERARLDTRRVRLERTPKEESHAQGDLCIVVLSQSCFFHETGGQPGDAGWLRTPSGKDLRVFDVVKEADYVLHLVVADPSTILAGDRVHGTVDWHLRMDHTRSHTATHIMNQTVRRVLGQHSWQAGTQKYSDCARVDMTHFRRPTREEVHAIEQLANRVVMQGRPVTRTWYKRDEAEKKYGMTLLQGGIPKGSDVRVVEIGAVAEPEGAQASLEDPHAPLAEPYDVEYCGGTHCHLTGEVGPIKIYRTERIQDGVERFEYSAGLYAAERWESDETLLRSASDALQVSPAELPAAAKRFFAEWKERGKLLEEVRKQLAELKAQAAAGEAQEVGGIRIIVDASLDPGALQKTAAELVAKEKTVVLLGAVNGDSVRLLFGRSADVEIDMGEVLREAAPIVGGKGGGRPDFAQGGGTDAAKLAECLEDGLRRVKGSLA